MKIIESHIVPAVSDKIRLQEYAATIFSSITSRSGIKKAIKRELILLNGVPAKTSDWISEGQRIDLLKSSSDKKIFELGLEVLYEDQDLAIIKKPSGYPTSGNFFKTIENALPYNLEESKHLDTLSAALPVHRLDSPTSGILLCAKTNTALVGLQAGFEKKEIRKIYTALVHGELRESKHIKLPIDFKSSETLIEKLELFKIDSSNYSLVKATPLTGRTHQIRIHLSKSGYPIVGDKIYGVEERGVFKNRQLYLFASGIVFDHPRNGSVLKFDLPLPKKFRNLKNLG
ncbi:RluA family pseudouridine synthase [Christiangramia salexigens]|uniref:RNA pseudouridine synthase n=1 Tax=Christiangramia salexigens TaxID=1913577 RepID=A0A1L3J5V7_9FLAO|nr:RluA family pseudouridine synthase [Christiangramia salexigens]APG60480.1 RNA pseudouridine synthase [Christiangramia salexigens]